MSVRPVAGFVHVTAIWPFPPVVMTAVTGLMVTGAGAEDGMTWLAAVPTAVSPDARCPTTVRVYDTPPDRPLTVQLVGEATVESQDFDVPPPVAVAVYPVMPVTPFGAVH